MKFKDIDKRDVKARAAGSWDRIILAVAPAIAPAIEQPGRVHIDCPMHGGRADFRVYRDFIDTGGGVCTCGNWPDGIDLVGAVNGWSFKESLSEIARLILGDETPPLPVRRVARKRATAREDAAIRQRLVSLWHGSASLEAPEAHAAARYFARRGLAFPGGIHSLRFHPALAYFDQGRFVGNFSGLVACVSAPDGAPVTIHRTFLTKDGQKAPVVSAKKLCAYPGSRRLPGAAVRLFPARDTVAVAEGIETSLAVTQLTGIPCWATVNAGLMAEFVPPDGIRRVLIYADRDRPCRSHPAGHGLEAAKALAGRLWRTGIRAAIQLPPDDIPAHQKGIDWLDVLAGVEARKVA
jgi:phage/plasmid primase-like uncharacterized protein